MKLFEAAAPSWVVLQLIEECNLRCAMCYEWGQSGAYHEKRQLATLDLETALKLVDECAPAKPHFELFGGEPLLHAGIFEIIRRIREHDCELSFPTNGTLLEQCADELVACPPTRLWISLDGPPTVNDSQRGRGVFKRVMRGIEAVVAAKHRRGTSLPELGLTCVVTPTNYRHVAELFLGNLDLTKLRNVSIELQSYLTEAQYREYVRLIRTEPGVPAAPYARAYVRDPAMFAMIDRDALVTQLEQVRDACHQHDVRFISQPGTITRANIDRYLAGDWAAMTDYRPRCAVPWTYAEVSASGDVTTCHTFYDAPLGNVHERPLLDIWRGDAASKLRAHLRGGLLPICTACCRYYQ
jgi:MoaA/NifB/PqqE/SkfB family radical SAM enzyme